jgi:hypothetical protein
MVISEARLAAGAKGLIWGIVAASVMVIVISAQAGGILLTGLLIAAGIVVLTWLIVRMTVSIAVTEESIVVRCEPFYSTEIPISDVLAVTTALVTSFSEGYGIRAMGKNTRGYLWEALRSLWKPPAADGSSQLPIPKKPCQQSEIVWQVSVEFQLVRSSCMPSAGLGFCTYVPPETVHSSLRFTPASLPKSVR